MTPGSRSLGVAVSVMVLAMSSGAAAGPPDGQGPEWRGTHAKAEAQRQMSVVGRRPLGSSAVGTSWDPGLGPSPVDVLHYDLQLFVDPDRSALAGSVEVYAEAVVGSLRTIELDADQGLRVLGVVLVDDETLPMGSPRALPFEHRDDRLAIDLHRPLAAGERVRLLVTYGGHAWKIGDGVNWSSHGGSPVVWTMAEPFGARVWWPCNDRPDDKALVDLAVTAPSQLVAASNGLETGRVEHAGGLATTSWSSRYPVATYLVVLNLSNYVVSSATYHAQDGSEMPVVTYAFPENAWRTESDLSVTAEMIEVLADRWGEYPFVEEKYGNCIAPFGGGMEHQTLTTFAASAIGGDWVDWLNVHELGHQWWGDWVTLDDWRELWLNEGFATYSEILWAEHLGEGTVAGIVEEMDWWGYFYGPVYDNPTPFSSTVYEKAAWVLRMLRFVVGDDAFFAGVADYREAHAGGTATTAELRSIMETASGMNLGWFFEQWVFGVNRPRYVWGWSAGGGPSVVLTVAQKQRNASLFRMPVEVAVDTDAGAEQHLVWLQALAEQTVEIQVGAAPRAVVLDPDHRLLCEMAEDDEPDLELGPDFPGPFDAGPVQVGSSAEIVVPMTNVGGGTLTVFNAEPNSGQEFTLAPGQHFPVNLAPGQSAEVRVRFRPQSPYESGDYLVINSNDPSRGVLYLSLEGVGTASPSPRLDAPAEIQVGLAPVGGLAQTGFWIANSGGQDLALTASVEGEIFSLAAAPPAAVAPGDWAYLAVRFSPTAVGRSTGTLVLQGNDPSRPRHEIALIGDGETAPRLSLAPAMLSFGPVLTRAEANLTLANEGDEDLELVAVELDTPWSLVSPPQLPASLAPGASVQLVVAFGPTGQGEVRGALRVLSDDPAVPLAVIPLGGMGLGEAAVAAVAAP